MAAIMLLTHSASQLNPQYISTTHGNQTVERTYLNARRTCALCNRQDIPVYRGFSKPLVRAGVACPEIHGESGLEGCDFSGIDLQLKRNPALDRLGYSDESQLKPTDFFAHLHELVAEAAARKERFQVITTGSMTNIAQYLSVYPSDAQWMKISCMAGNFMIVGNIMPFAEFNVLIDPEAVDLILKSDVEVTFAAPLDITHTVLVTESVLGRMQNEISKISPEFCKMLIGLLTFFKKTYHDVFGFESPPLHDPVAVFYLLRPDLFEEHEAHVDIETKGEFTYGACCHDLILKKKDGSLVKPVNAKVCLKLKEGGLDEFWNAMIGAWVSIAKKIESK
jgi:inosine-uridine nucleoside N-ribohydrolase